MIIIFFTIIVTAALVVVLFLYREHLRIAQNRNPFMKNGNVSWIDFYVKGAESGFNGVEIKLLHELAKKSDMEHPAALFWSTGQMDACLKYIVHRYLAAGTFDAEDNQAFLDKLFTLRKKLEMDKPRWKTGITKTSELSDMQSIQMVTEKYGTFNTKVLKNTSAAIVVERPLSAALPVDAPWKGQAVQVYFWRKEDASYYFDTLVSEEIFTGAMPALKLLHNNKLTRAQNRNHIRIQINKSARMYALDPEDTDHKTSPAGIRCSLRDISENGCQIKAGGRAEPELKLIIQFTLDKTPVNLAGTVHSVEYNEKENISILHIQMDLMPLAVRNRIRCIVFGIVDEDFNIKPFSGGDSSGEESAAAAEEGVLAEEDALAEKEAAPAPEAGDESGGAAQ